MAKGELTIILDPKDLEKMNQCLEALTELERVPVLQKGFQEGTRLFVKQGKVNLEASLSTDPHNVASAAYMAKKHGGSLRNAFGTWTKKHFVSKSTREKTVKGYAGFYRKKGGGIAHMPDSGTKERWTKKGYYRGSVSKGAPKTGSQFWHRAVASKGAEALNTLMDSIKKSILLIIQTKYS